MQTKIVMEDGTETCDIFTSQYLMQRRLRKLRSLYPGECRMIEAVADTTEHWQCPFWWFNCRKRNRPQPYSKPTMNKAEEQE